MPLKSGRRPTLKVLPLGGLGEIGKNMMVLEVGEDIVVIDAGVLFPEYDMPGVEVVIPNLDYLSENADRVRAIMITHGHEDHIGAVPYVVDHVEAPVYAPPMAVELLRHKLRESRRLDKTDLRIARPGDTVRAGELTAEWFPVCHSIPDAHGIAVHTPLGTVIHTGDFKIDHDPVIGHPTDFTDLARIAADGVFLLLSDSTYAEDEGYSGSDRIAAEGLFKVITEAEGRVFVASFASQIARVQIAADAARATGRRLAVLGRSMINNIRIARELGHLDIPQELMVKPAEAASLPDHRVLYMTTGSQGEPSSVLVRMSRGEHRDVDVRVGDTIVISANAIPGNEVSVNESIDDLVRLGARVITNRQQVTHVQGHARREELRSIINLTQPRYFVPVHGEYRMLKAHAGLAMDHGLAEDDVFILTDGDQLELSEHGGEIVDKLPAGHVFVHGLGMWDESGNVVVERRSLARDGIVVISLARGRDGKIRGEPKFVSAGFVHSDQSDVLFKDTKDALSPVLDRARNESIQWTRVENQLRVAAARFLGKRTRRRPLIILVPVEV